MRQADKVLNINNHCCNKHQCKTHSKVAPVEKRHFLLPFFQMIIIKLISSKTFQAWFVSSSTQGNTVKRKKKTTSWTFLGCWHILVSQGFILGMNWDMVNRHNPWFTHQEMSFIFSWQHNIVPDYQCWLWHNYINKFGKKKNNSTTFQIYPTGVEV